MESGTGLTYTIVYQTDVMGNYCIWLKELYSPVLCGEPKWKNPTNGEYMYRLQVGSFAIQWRLTELSMKTSLQ